MLCCFARPRNHITTADEDQKTSKVMMNGLHAVDSRGTIGNVNLRQNSPSAYSFTLESEVSDAKELHGSANFRPLGATGACYDACTDYLVYCQHGMIMVHLSFDYRSSSAIDSSIRGGSD